MKKIPILGRRPMGIDKIRYGVFVLSLGIPEGKQDDHREVDQGNDGQNAFLPNLLEVVFLHGY